MFGHPTSIHKRDTCRHFYNLVDLFFSQQILTLTLYFEITAHIGELAAIDQTSSMRSLLGIILLVSSCGDNPDPVPAETAHLGLELSHSPAVQYPSVDYDEVALYSVNADHYTEEALLPLNAMQYAEETVGFAILDSLGNPAFQNIGRTMLSPVEVKELQSIFQLPENKGEITETMCIAFYRDAFVFYKNKRQVAQAQICFDCNQVYFLSDTTNLADRFNTEGDWNRLQRFVFKVKAE